MSLHPTAFPLSQLLANRPGISSGIKSDACLIVSPPQPQPQPSQALILIDPVQSGKTQQIETIKQKMKIASALLAMMATAAGSVQSAFSIIGNASKDAVAGVKRYARQQFSRRRYFPAAKCKGSRRARQQCLSIRQAMSLTHLDFDGKRFKTIGGVLRSWI